MTQQRGEEASKIERLISKAQYVFKYRTSKHHQTKVGEYRKVVNAVKHRQCHFVDFSGGCKYNKEELRKTCSHCPYNHSPPLVAGNCYHKGTVKVWKGGKPQGKCYGYISLENGNELFFPDRVLNQFQPHPKKGQAVTVTSIEVPARDGELFMASKVKINETQKTGEPSPAT